MGKIVVLAEKPSVGRSIAKVLGCKTSEDGYISGGNYIVTWAVGHLVTLQNPDDIDEKYKKWDMATLPMLPEKIPLKVISGTSKQFKIVKSLINASTTDSLVCATDAGREGELIFRYIYYMAGCKKPFKRLWISSLTDEAIRNGFSQLEPGTNYDALYRSAQCRSEADWLVGMNASRAYTLRYNTLLSVGRVQTPTLAFLVKRRLEIENFVPEKYYTLRANFGDYTGIMFSEKLNPDTHIKEKEQADKLAAIIQGKTGIITEAETQRKKEQQPQLYDLTTLQRDANKRFGFTAEKTLQLAQSLYETHKALTYPRTDSRYLPQNMIPVVAETMRKLPEEYQPLVKGALTDGKVTVTKRNFDDSKVSDHHALLPTNQRADMSRMSSDEKKLFDMVVKRMLEAFYPVCEYDATKIITTVGRFTFRTTGKTIIKPGWRAVRGINGNEDNKEEKDGEEENAGSLPVVKVNDTRTVKDSEIKESFTKAPPQYNDASLLLAMETAGKDATDSEIAQQMKGHGIGTPATRAAIIERLIEVKYAERKGKAIQATDKGVALIQIMPEDISSAETTGKWEHALDQIADNKRDPRTFRESICKFASFLVNHAKTNSTSFNEAAFQDEKRNKPRASKHEGFICPVCQKGDILETERSFGCARWKEGCGFTVWKDTFLKKYGFSLDKDDLETLINGGKLDKTYRDKTGGAEVDVTVHLDGQYGYKSIYCSDKDTKEVLDIVSIERWTETCPNCNKKALTENFWMFSCSECGLTIWKNSFSRDNGPRIITRSMIYDLITEGKTEALELGTNRKAGYLKLDGDTLSWFVNEAALKENTPEKTCQLMTGNTSGKKKSQPRKGSSRPKRGKTTTRKRK